MKLELQLFAKSINEIAKEVISGNWGNGADRKNRLTAAGYNYSEVQSLVNSMLGGKSTTAPKTTTPSTTTPKAPTTTASATPTTPSDFKYDEFKESDDTIAADKNRKDLNSQKPGDFTYDPYEKSDVVKQAEALLQQQLANKPGEYSSNWQAQLDETLNKILNREKFTYDLNGDALYQQYKDQYMLQGQQAMMDTMGQAQAMTGGFGNSYAQTVGQQTYQGYLQQLNDKFPELYQLALDQYNQEGQDLYNQYGLYADRENQEYGRYRDTVSDYNTELARLTEDARYQSESDYGKWMDAYNMAYGQHRDEVTDWQNEQDRADSEYWNQYNRDYNQYTDNKDFDYGQFIDKLEYDYKVNRDAIADAETKKKYAYDTAMGMLNLGVTPSAEMLKDAGISSADANAIVKKVKANEAKAEEQNKTPTPTPTPTPNPTPTPTPDPALNKSKFEGWTATDWNSYFAQIRQTEGKAAAEKELEEFTKNGIIPTKFVSSAAIGARGSLGH